MFNATSYSAAETGNTLGHGLLGRGSCVHTRHSDATGENQSVDHSTKPPQIFNQPVKIRCRPPLYDARLRVIRGRISSGCVQVVPVQGVNQGDMRVGLSHTTRKPIDLSVSVGPK